MLEMSSPSERRNHKSMRDGMGRFKSERKRQKGPNGDHIDESPAKLVKIRLLDNVSPLKAVAGEPHQEQ